MKAISLLMTLLILSQIAYSSERKVDLIPNTLENRQSMIRYAMEAEKNKEYKYEFHAVSKDQKKHEFIFGIGNKPILKIDGIYYEYKMSNVGYTQFGNSPKGLQIKILDLETGKKLRELFLMRRPIKDNGIPRNSYDACDKYKLHLSSPRGHHYDFTVESGDEVFGKIDNDYDYVLKKMMNVMSHEKKIYEGLYCSISRFSNIIFLPNFYSDIFKPE